MRKIHENLKYVKIHWIFFTIVTILAVVLVAYVTKTSGEKTIAV